MGRKRKFKGSKNYRSLNAFYQGVRRAWFRALRRRSQRHMSYSTTDLPQLQREKSNPVSA